MSDGANFIRDVLEADRQNGGGAIEAALEISRRRRELLERLRDALLNERSDEALALARQYCGLEDKKPDA